MEQKSTNMTILSIGVDPENQLAKEAGLELGARSHRGKWIFTELPERESPLLQLWDESEVKPGVSSDTLMVWFFIILIFLSFI